MVTEGTACATPNCKARLHPFCYRSYRNRHDTCPTCQTKWGTDTSKVRPVGEGAFKDGQDKGKRRARQASEGSDEEGEEQEEADYDEASQSQSQPSQSQPARSQPSRSQKKGKKKAVREDSMDVDGEQEVEEDEPQPTQRRRSSRR